jgi:predicted GIY-YIG superfamily endonuclease
MTTAGAPVPGQDPGTVYLLHLDPPYRHARHYIGWTKDLAARVDAHREGRGARLMEVVKQAGGTFRLARTWPGDRARERAIKDRKEAPKLCPECSPHPRPVEHGRSATAPPPTVPAPRPAPEPAQVDYYARGAGMARQFLAAQLAAGRTADQIAAAHDYITGPWRAADHHKPAQAETYRGYADHVGQQLMQLRAGEVTAPAPEPSARQQPQMEAGA